MAYRLRGFRFTSEATPTTISLTLEAEHIDFEAYARATGITPPVRR